VPAKPRHRQRVENLVGQDDAVEARAGRCVQPFHALSQKARNAFPEHAALPLAQIGAHFEYQVARRQSSEHIEARQEVSGKSAASCADLQDHRLAQRTDNVGALLRQAGAEQARHFGSGDEVAPLPQFACARAVVTQTRRIEHEVHVAFEADPAACLPDLAFQPLAHLPGVGELFGAQLELRRHGYPLPGQSGIVLPHGG
jgi:hypothetical protein